MLRIAITVSLAVGASLATLVAPVQTPVETPRNNLVHATTYVPCELGTLGALVERGHGPIDMILVSGFGLGASAFERFAERNAERYRMFVVTLPGFEGTPAPPMPPTGTSYGEQTWTRAAVGAVVKAIRERGLDRPVIVGHFLNGTQVAARVAIEHPELVRALVLLAASSRFEPLEGASGWPRGMTLPQKIDSVDKVLAPKWFQLVTPETWIANNFKRVDYSVDPERGARFAELANRPPLPVLVRYLCEFHASDVRAEFERLTCPVLMIQPRFTEALRSDAAHSYLKSFFDEPWKGIAAEKPALELVELEGAGIMVMDDRADEVDRRVAEFVGKHRP